MQQKVGTIDACLPPTTCATRPATFSGRRPTRVATGDLLAPATPNPGDSPFLNRAPPPKCAHVFRLPLLLLTCYPRPLVITFRPRLNLARETNTRASYRMSSNTTQHHPHSDAHQHVGDEQSDGSHHQHDQQQHHDGHHQEHEVTAGSSGQGASEQSPHHHNQQQNEFHNGGGEHGNASAGVGKQESGDGNNQHTSSQQQQQQQQHAARALLAQWDPEQLARIVEAARATETGSQATDASGNYVASASIYEQARQALASMPGNIGQATSALSEFAAGFKRSDSVAEDGNGDRAHDDSGTGQGSTDQHQQSLEEQGSHDQTQGDETQEGDTLDTTVDQSSAQGNSHDSAATAAAIAAMGTLAGHHLDNPDAPAPSADELSENLPSSSNARKVKAGKIPENDRQRKDNHKEVERRRRAGINSAIAELQTIVPGCDEKNVNKGDVIYRAAQYIRDLKTNEASNIEKWTLEKLLMDQAMNDYGAQLDASRREVERLRERFGKEADEVPRAEEINWGQQQHEEHHHHHHHQQDGDEQDHPMGDGHEEQHHRSGQVDPRLESGHQQEGRDGERRQQDDGGDAHNNATGALNDVAAAAAAAARAVAATAPGEEDTSSSDAVRFSENVEAVRAAAAAAAAGVESNDGKDDSVLDALTNDGTVQDDGVQEGSRIQRGKRTSQGSPPAKNIKRQKA